MWQPLPADVRLAMEQDNRQDMSEQPSTPAASPAATTLHLLGRFSQPFTGAERELLDLRRLIGARRPVRLWSDAPVHACYAAEGISVIQPFAQQFPRGGTLLMSGVHLKPDVWLKYARFERLVLWHNLSNQGQLFAVIEGVRRYTGLEPEIVFVSQLLQRSAALPGRLIPSLIDLAPFLAVARERLAAAAHPDAAVRPVTVGRASRDVLDKHHPDDVSLYRMLAGRGIRVRIMGGTCLAPALGDAEGIELLPAGAQDMPDFYRSLDAVFYRTFYRTGAFIEAYGRVVIEAMGSGLPVVAHARGGYVDALQDGSSGFLIGSQEEAYDTLIRLAGSAALRRDMGQAAMLRAMELHGPQAAERDAAFYLR